MNWLIVLLAFSFVSCASSSNRDFTEGKNNRPEWVNDPAEFCGDEKLCAVGEGTSLTRAEVAARKNLAKIFRVEINSTTNISEHSVSTTTPGLVQSEGVTPEVALNTREVVDEVLEGVVTAKKHQEGIDVFALAELDKNTSAKLIKPRIAAIDSEIQEIVNSARRSLLPRAFELESARTSLQNFLAVLGISDFSRGISRGQLLALQQKYDAAPLRVLIANEGEWDAIARTIESELSNLGYKIVSQGPFHAQVKINNSAQREYLNVKGFERYHVNVQLTALDQAGKTLGALGFEQVENGRSLAQIRARILEEFKKSFITNFSQLHLD